jgi:hypothetical protein
MSTTETWIGRLSIPVLILLHASGAVLGAVLFFIFGVIILVILQIEDKHNSVSIVGTFFLIGAILPSLILWRARNKSLRAMSPRSAVEREFMGNTSPILDFSGDDLNIDRSTERPPVEISDRPRRQNTVNNLRDAADYNQTIREVRSQRPNNDHTSPQDSYGPSSSNNIGSLLKPSPFRWRWWHTLSTLLSVIAVVAIIPPSINIPIQPSLDLELTRGGLLFEGQGNSVEILNVGTKSVKIVGMSINHRADCTINGFSIFTEGIKKPPLPAEIKVGEKLNIWSSCLIVRATIETNYGSNTYSFTQ